MRGQFASGVSPDTRNRAVITLRIIAQVLSYYDYASSIPRPRRLKQLLLMMILINPQLHMMESKPVIQEEQQTQTNDQ